MLSGSPFKVKSPNTTGGVMAIILRRGELYRQVWLEPMGQLSRKLDIPSAKLREVCKTMAIPVPPLDYWNAIKAGKTISPTPLPQHAGADVIQIGSARDRALAKRAALNHSPAQQPEAQNGHALQSSAAVPVVPAQKQARYITLDEWAQATFSHPPHKNTLFRWANEGRIQPQPRKIGRRWWVEPRAEYRAD